MAMIIIIMIIIIIIIIMMMMMMMMMMIMIMITLFPPKFEDYHTHIHVDNKHQQKLSKEQEMVRMYIKANKVLRVHFKRNSILASVGLVSNRLRIQFGIMLLGCMESCASNIFYKRYSNIYRKY